ncbi:MAG: CoA transferase [Dehalococcoidia bacterium]
MPTTANHLPFTGLNVLDFAWAVVGPVTTKYLALYGARVVKVETAHRLDSTRMTGPYLDAKAGKNRSGLFANHNLSKLGISLNLDSHKGVELALKLAAWADVVTENFSPGVMEKLGLGYRELVKVNPDLIMLSLSMQGQTGPLAGHPGLGHFLQSLVGLDHMTGFPQWPPGGPNQVLPDFISPWFAIAALASALEHRRRTGRGQYIDMSQYEVTLHLLAPALMRCALDGAVFQRQGNRNPGAAPHGVYPCQPDEDLPELARDQRWVAIACFTDAQWRALTDVMGNPAMARDSGFATLLARKRNEDELDRLVARWTRGRPPREAMERLQRAGVPAAWVANGRDVLEDRQLEARGHFHKLTHPILGRRPFDGPAWRMSALTPVVGPAPLFAEHNEYVFRELLELSDDDIADLVAKGVVDFV